MQNGISKVVVVGASAGGMEALTGLVAQLPADFPAPVFIVNHMSAETTGEPLVRALNKAGRVKCSHATDEEPFKRGHVYLAPSDQHLLVSGTTLDRLWSPRRSCESGHSRERALSRKEAGATWREARSLSVPGTRP